jgi:hypothetical protein
MDRDIFSQRPNTYTSIGAASDKDVSSHLELSDKGGMALQNRKTAPKVELAMLL